MLPETGRDRFITGKPGGIVTDPHSPVCWLVFKLSRLGVQQKWPHLTDNSSLDWYIAPWGEAVVYLPDHVYRTWFMEVAEQDRGGKWTLKATK
jgi:hypothetical protein